MSHDEKPAARKPAARKPAARKPAAKKPQAGQGTQDVRIEHVLAAVDQIAKLCAQVRSALEGMDPKTVARSVRGGMGGPNPPMPVSYCDTPPPGEHS